MQQMDRSAMRNAAIGERQPGNCPGRGERKLMASTSTSPVRPARLCAVLLAALIIWALTPGVASAQAPPTIDAVDSPSQAWQPSTATVPTGTTVRWEFDQATQTHSLTSTSANWSVDETRS